MSVGLCDSLVDFGGVRDALADIRACHADSERFFAEVFAEFDSTTSELQARSQQLMQAGREDQARLSQYVDDRDGRLQALLDQLGKDQAGLSALVNDGHRRQQQADQLHNAIQSQLARLVETIDHLALQQHAETAQAPKAADPPAELTNLGSQLAHLMEIFEQQRGEMDVRETALRAELARLTETVARMTESPLDGNGTPSGAGPADAAQQMVRQSQIQREQFDQQLQVLEDQVRSIAEIAKGLTQPQEPSIESSELTGLYQQVAQFAEATQKQFAELGSREAALRTEIARVAEATAESAATRGEMAERFRRLEEIASSAASNPNKQELDGEMQRLAQQHAQLQQERTALEAELDAVRVRGAELSEALSAEKQQAQRQQAVWGEELQQIRRTLERLTQRPSAAPAAAAPDRSGMEATPSGGHRSTAGNDDPVLSSVLAQFALLQEDAARRRAARSGES